MPGLAIRQDYTVAHIAVHNVVEGTLVDVNFRGEDRLNIVRLQNHKERNKAQPEPA